MKALILEEVHQPLQYQEIESTALAANQVRIQIKAAAMNHRDVYISKGLYPGIKTPITLGSDGAGIVSELGENVDPSWLNQEVILNPSIDWGDNPAVQAKDYHILGMPTNGTFAEELVVDAKQLALKPKHLSFEQAAALPLAGLTAYRSLISKAKAKAGERVLISGVGGGVALMACQFAIAIGAEVWVTSGSESKIKRAIALGAKGGVNYKSDDWYKTLKKQAAGGFDVIVDSAGGEGFSKFLDLANMAGRIVFYGGTRGSFKINPQKMFWKQLSIYGSTMGHTGEFKDMLKLVEEKQIEPVVDTVWKLEQGNEAFAHMHAGKQFGKIVFAV